MNEEETIFWRGFESRIERLEDVVRDLDEMLRGDRRKHVLGILSEYDRMDRELRKLSAVIFMDSTGKHGLAHDVDVLMDRRAGKEKRIELHWAFWTAVCVAIISGTTTILLNWKEIRQNLEKEKQEIMSPRVIQVKSPRKIVRYKVVHTTPSDDTKESPPNPQE